MQSIRIKLKCFATVKDIIGTAEKELIIPAGITINDLLLDLIDTYPDLGIHEKNLLTAVDEEYRDRDYTLDKDSVIAIFPPVSGG